MSIGRLEVFLLSFYVIQIEIQHSIDGNNALFGFMSFAAALYLQALLRICCLRNFGYKMAALTGSSFTYNKEKRMFFGPSSDSSNQDPDTQVRMVSV